MRRSSWNRIFRQRFLSVLLTLIRQALDWSRNMTAAINEVSGAGRAIHVRHRPGSEETAEINSVSDFLAWHRYQPHAWRSQRR
jgi:hypothetical protein